MAHQGLYIDYNFCTGCMTCQIACQMEKGLSDDQNGILIQQIGPFQVEGEKWEFDYIPVPTDFCDLCAHRTELGKQPTCVQHCQAACMEWGSIEELAKKVISAKQVIFAV